MKVHFHVFVLRFQPEKKKVAELIISHKPWTKEEEHTKQESAATSLKHHHHHQHHQANQRSHCHHLFNEKKTEYFVSFAPFNHSLLFSINQWQLTKWSDTSIASTVICHPSNIWTFTVDVCFDLVVGPFTSHSTTLYLTSPSVKAAYNIVLLLIDWLIMNFQLRKTDDGRAFIYNKASGRKLCIINPKHNNKLRLQQPQFNGKQRNGHNSFHYSTSLEPVHFSIVTISDSDDDEDDLPGLGGSSNLGSLYPGRDNGAKTKHLDLPMVYQTHVSIIDTRVGCFVFYKFLKQSLLEHHQKKIFGKKGLHLTNPGEFTYLNLPLSFSLVLKGRWIKSNILSHPSLFERIKGYMIKFWCCVTIGDYCLIIAILSLIFMSVRTHQARDRQHCFPRYRLIMQ